MIHTVAAWIGLVASGAVLAVLVALALSLPVVLARAMQVARRREWVPLTYSLRSLWQRKATTIASFFVLALVVFVLTAVLMLAFGIRHTLESTGDPSNAKVLRANALVESTSWITEEELKQIAVAPGLALDPSGQPLLSAEMVALIWDGYVGSSDPDEGANLTVRGVEPVAFDVHAVGGLKGRRFTKHTTEIIIGAGLEGRFRGAEVGGTMTFADRDWTVVGVADHGGNAHDSEIWGDFHVMSTTFWRETAVVTVAMTDPSAFDAFATAINGIRGKRIGLVAKREPVYWRSLSENYVEFVVLVGGVVGFIFAFGAVLGALNTTYAQVDARTRELGMLRAIGFKPRAILVSLLFESVLLALGAGAVGIAGASILGKATFTLTALATASEISYDFHLSPALALACLGFAALMGYAGGLLPALSAARMPIVDAVRAD
jgi:putative ABC transport system permease protein